MTKAILIQEPGAAGVLKWVDVRVGKPAPKEVRVRHTAVGLNYIDIYHRSGHYPLPQYPAPLGMEGAGVIEAVGRSVRGLKVGQRVAYATLPLGAYAQARLIAADRVVPVPAEVSDEIAAAVMLKGMTAEYLIRRTYRVGKNDTILVHAAAGGVGTILCQWAKHLGATVIGTVGSARKARLARALGCDHVIDYSRQDVAARVQRITRGAGVPVVFDGVGKATFSASIDSLAPRGLMVCFGNASGPAPLIDTHMLGHKGSLYLTRPSLVTYTAVRSDLLASARALFKVIAEGHVKVGVSATFALKDAAKAQRALEKRQTTGSTVLIP
ncbi:MAG: quinone oxidoreductase [Rhodospirillales bacterium]|jgi:NADPH2:quinone reductase|nr:quinone oxidoreductase [Rhodospirillales bacterium]MDP6884716.1 quinone oxidoreductase [Rhodospirillales bacterium]